MGRRYHHLDAADREVIARLRAAGASYRQIATALDRAPSTIAREVRRNTLPSGRYEATYATQAAQSHRWRGSKLDRDAMLREQVLCGLQAGCSPEQVAGRLRLVTGRPRCSHETIYRWLYAQVARHKAYAWGQLLPRGRTARRARGSRQGRPRIPARVSIHTRPPAVDQRVESGHWEVDLMHFRQQRAALQVTVERVSRYLLLARVPSKHAQGVCTTLTQQLQRVPAVARRTVTFDNGTEWTAHQRLHRLGMATYFCDCRAPWQKGSVENSIARLRRALPRRTRLATWSPRALQALAHQYNQTPRKCLGYRTPAEVFHNQVLHFKRESTSPPARG